MTKSKAFPHPLFYATTTTLIPPLVNQNNTFNSIFSPQPLDPTVDSAIQKLLEENFSTEKMQEEQIQIDLEHLRKITSEINSISKQSIVLIGERVFKARELLKPYKDGTFTKWVENIFGSKKTAYNMLSYFELHNALANEEIQNTFKKIPQTSAYMLASRAGDIRIKENIIREYHSLKHEELVTLIQKMLPVPNSDKRKNKNGNNKLIHEMIRCAKMLIASKTKLTEENQEELHLLRNLLKNILTEDLIL